MTRLRNPDPALRGIETALFATAVVATVAFAWHQHWQWLATAGDAVLAACIVSAARHDGAVMLAGAGVGFFGGIVAACWTGNWSWMLVGLVVFVACAALDAATGRAGRR
jgi:hypothetical protein